MSPRKSKQATMQDIEMLASGDDESESSTHDNTPLSEERDEVGEVKKLAARDTRKVRLWRVLMAVALLATATAVTLITYQRLYDEEIANFETAFEQFSRTVGRAAVEQQRTMREAYYTLGDTVSAHAQITNATWPEFTMPKFEHFASNARQQGSLEFLAVFNYLEPQDIDDYIEYSNGEYEKWVHEGHMIGYGNLDNLNPVGYKPFLSRPGPDGFVEDIERPFSFAMWTFSPPPSTYGVINWAINSLPDIGAVASSLLVLGNETLITPVRPYAGVPLAFTEEVHNQMHSELAASSTTYPHSFAYRLLKADVDDPNSRTVGMIGGAFAWDAALRFLLPVGVNGIVSIVENDCNQTFTYLLNGPDAFFMGAGDSHETKFDKFRVQVNLALHDNPLSATTPGHCQYRMSIYPSTTFEDAYHTDTPMNFAITLAVTFAAVCFIFVMYDIMVQRRNEKLIKSNANSNAIVSSLFPGQIRDQLLQQQKDASDAKSKKHLTLKSALVAGDVEEDNDGISHAPPLADYFIDCSVLFADISGFTAWSSQRHPSEVFLLLESLFGKYDEIARQRRIFKVETVGDCYVAVTGLPHPRADHATAMCRFARDILYESQNLFKKLETKLGPDTGDLQIRIGIHSGPVTGGVLRGDRARFQLFGDTMNMAARMESTGQPLKVHLSSATADILKSQGRQSWLEERAGKVAIKGKADAKTYWLSLRGCRQRTSGSIGDASSTGAGESHQSSEGYGHDAIAGLCRKKTARLVDWNVQVLCDLLKQIVAVREVTISEEKQSKAVFEDDSRLEKGDMPLTEVKEIIALPEFSQLLKNKHPRSADEVELDAEVVTELHDFVTAIASMYNPNSFHNFEHASHVVASVKKMLSRIVAPNDVLDHRHDNVSGSMAMSLHDHTYGITSDPLTQFTTVLSALIHDVDHVGVPNNQLNLENPALASIYGERSVAEQNSLDLSWGLLMDHRFENLRSVLCATHEEVERFRQLLVNSVMATDISDKDLKALRNARWEKAFDQSDLNEDEESRDAVNRKATIVIEHLIQASDVSHTMQHWHVYRKWNERLYEEMYKAYKEGRAAKDPAEFWYKGEIGFFDFYIIPLAKKLKDCGVFGVSSDEYLNYALENRREWEEKGQEVVASMVEKMKAAEAALPEQSCRVIEEVASF